MELRRAELHRCSAAPWAASRQTGACVRRGGRAIRRHVGSRSINALPSGRGRRWRRTQKERPARPAPRSLFWSASAGWKRMRMKGEGFLNEATDEWSLAARLRPPGPRCPPESAGEWPRGAAGPEWRSRRQSRLLSSPLILVPPLDFWWPQFEPDCESRATLGAGTRAPSSDGARNEDEAELQVIRWDPTCASAGLAFAFHLTALGCQRLFSCLSILSLLGPTVSICVRSSPASPWRPAASPATRSLGRDVRVESDFSHSALRGQPPASLIAKTG